MATVTERGVYHGDPNSDTTTCGKRCERRDLRDGDDDRRNAANGNVSLKLRNRVTVCPDHGVMGWDDTWLVNGGV